VLRIDDAATGDPLAVLYNFASHPICLHSYQNVVSPDIPGYAREVIRAVLGPEVVVLYTLGAAGDINPSRHVNGKGTPRRARQLGAILGCEVAKVALEIEPGDDAATLQVVRQAVELPVERLPAPAELEEMRAQAAANAERKTAEGRPWAEVAIEQVRRDWAEEALRAWQHGPQSSRTCEIQALRIGDAAIVALPLEVFVETGLAIKDASAAPLTVISSMSNGALGYLPTRHAYETAGDYTNPQGLAPKVYDLYAFAQDAEHLLRREARQVVAGLGWP
jgi:hypothetical protein